MGIHHQGLADLPEFLALMAASQGLQTHPVEDALATPVSDTDCFAHGPMMRATPCLVNCPTGRVFPKRHAAGAGALEVPMTVTGLVLRSKPRGIKCRLLA